VKSQERSALYLYGLEKVMTRDILPFFGKTPIAKVDVVMWNKFVGKKQNQVHPLARATLHQCKNALRAILNEAYRTGLIKSVPVLKDASGGPRVKTPRVWFEPSEYRKLLSAIRAHAKTLRKTRWEDDANELYDYVVFNTNAGLRVGEARNVRFCDITEHQEMIDNEARKFLLIKNIKGKRGTGECRTMDGAVDAFHRIVARRKIADPKTSTELLFLAYHRDMFRTLLENANLRWTNERPPRKRDLTVCRHTYISFRLLYGANAFEIANNCRTSTQMIHEHYSRWLSPRLTKGLNVRRWTELSS
jgi:integrase